VSADRETLELDVLIVGGGPAGLAAAIHLSRLLKSSGREAAVALVEKSAEIGDHAISGAVLDPSALRDLVPDFEAQGAPIAGPVRTEGMLYFTKTGHWRLPWVPPSLHHTGGLIVSLNDLNRWLGDVAAKAGVDMFCGFPAAALLFEEDRVVGVRTGDKGIDKHGQKRPNYEPGVDIRAGVTILCDGARGNLTKQLLAKLGLDAGCNPQIYATGVKEVWKIPEGRVPAGSVYHTLGFPLDSRTFGGGFLYDMGDGLWSIGLVAGLDAPDPWLDPHALFQKFKTHPFVKSRLEGGEIVSYGAKAIPEGGYWAIPRVATAGALIAGDAAGLVNVPRLKGIHLAMRSGMLAAETAAAAIAAGDTGAAALEPYAKAIDSGAVGREMYASRNFRQAYQSGLFAGSLHYGLQLVTGGRGVRQRYAGHADYQMKRRITEYPGGHPVPVRGAFDGKLTFDRVTDVYHSGTKHDENQPAHLLVADTEICRTRCAAEYGNPCRFFCPAAVYEMVPDAERGGERLQINFSNCVHCKTCDIADPYQIITWTTPEGGGGPHYRKL